jgi:hypothetical protein
MKGLGMNISEFISTDGRPTARLAEAWPEDVELDAHKLDRWENPRADGNCLYFDVERHGAVCMGSIYAEVQTWRFALDTGEADLIGSDRRQLGSRERPLKIEPLAEEVADIIRSGTDDPRVQFVRTGAKVVLSETLPPAVKETWEGRRKRFYRALDAKLAPDFVRGGAIYRRSEPDVL